MAAPECNLASVNNERTRPPLHSTANRNQCIRRPINSRAHSPSYRSCCICRPAAGVEPAESSGWSQSEASYANYAVRRAASISIRAGTKWCNSLCETRNELDSIGSEIEILNKISYQIKGSNFIALIVVALAAAGSPRSPLIQSLGRNFGNIAKPTRLGSGRRGRRASSKHK